MISFLCNFKLDILSGKLPDFFLTNYLQFICENVKRMISFQVISCRVIGQAEDNVPIVQLYTATFNQEKGQLESILVNKEVKFLWILLKNCFDD